ncbi:hypothetical protein C1924_18845 [Stenotrophomonas sp. ESTM1D_MKCIP4_1]|uniref:hypothetical protein n=1 Tax=Stenotrophomonas sp. ESTM1D_MKCIP4_1 TaxID=2072414 RepID=UPI000D541C90|nr:hypothetical protein [Stenotrophomonas sp. ESTM1D_MKCIP4_1]AWH55101.1 hypothetical protein C1924_18845 [Stenotrophomonas sp. ESTM1D_MKCIP4_1]
MTELTFRMFVLLTILVTVGGIVADERGARTLPRLLREERLRIKERAVAASMSRPVLGALRIGLVVGYLAALVAVAFFVPFSPWIYIFFTLGWSALTALMRRMSFRVLHRCSTRHPCC